MSGSDGTTGDTTSSVVTKRGAPDVGRKHIKLVVEMLNCKGQEILRGRVKEALETWVALPV